MGLLSRFTGRRRARYQGRHAATAPTSGGAVVLRVPPVPGGSRFADQLHRANPDLPALSMHSIGEVEQPPSALEPRVALGFDDGSQLPLDEGSPLAQALQATAERLLSPDGSTAARRRR